MGVMFTPKTTILLDSKIHDKEVFKDGKVEIPIKYRYLKYPISCKNSFDKECEIELYAINWPYLAKTRHEENEEDKNSTPYGMILEMLSEIGNIEPSVVDKYENTIQFVKKCLEVEEKH